MTTPTAARTVSNFSITPAGVVTGPAAYMAERGAARLRQIEAGRDVVVNFGLGEGRDPLTLALVSLQTDYSAWLGERQFTAQQAAARESQLRAIAQIRSRKAR